MNGDDSSKATVVPVQNGKILKMLDQRSKLSFKLVDFPELTSLEFSKEVCRSMVAMLDFDKSGKLGLNELKCLFNEITMWRVSYIILINLSRN